MTCSSTRACDRASLVRKVYLLEDCTSPVVVPGVVDYTEQADAAFRRFAEAGMHVVRSTDPIEKLARHAALRRRRAACGQERR